jgi:hypothetical protein
MLAPYVAQGWVYVAVRLTPATADQVLTGTLDPLWVTFDSDKIIYPMRPTAMAKGELPVFLYVLAEHHVEKPVAFAEEDWQRDRPIGRATVPYALWVQPAALQQNSPLVPFIQRKLFLTKFNIFLTNPVGIVDDFVFPFAARDETFHEVEVHYVVADAPAADTASPNAAVSGGNQPPTEAAGATAIGKGSQ